MGLNWKVQTDVFYFCLQFGNINQKILNFEKLPTKREVLAVVMSVFDPFGFLANFVVSGKLLMQQIWKCGIDWDQAVSEGIYKKWKIWLEELRHVENISIPRCYHNTFLSESVSLHVFADAH